MIPGKSGTIGYGTGIYKSTGSGHRFIRQASGIFLLVIFTVSAAGCESEPVPETDVEQIQPWEENPRFWQFRGEPVLLLGGTDTDALFQWEEDQLAEHLNLLISSGGNYVRNVMSSRNPDERGDVHPFRQLEDGRYDLEAWNPVYWDRFERMLKMTAERNIVVQIELWDGHDFQSRQDTEEGFPQWDAHPFNPRNNINYTKESTGIPVLWTRGYPNETHPVLLTTPGQNDVPEVLNRQERFVDAVMQHSLKYDHVLYVIQNESWAGREWSDHWAAFLRTRAEAEGREIYIADMTFEPDVRPVLERDFDFGEFSQSASGAGRPEGIHIRQAHFDFIAGQWEQLNNNPAPVNSVKQYGGDEVDWSMGSDEGVDRVWRSVFSGQAAVRFHRPPTGLGLGERARTNIRSLRDVSGRIDIFQVQPHQRVVSLLDDRSENEAYLMADPGRAYAVYFTPEGRRVRLDVSAMEGEIYVSWIDPDTAQWRESELVSGDTITLTKPGSGQWVAVVTGTGDP